MKNLRISFVGDILINNIAENALKQDNVLSKYFRDGDLLIANFEAPVTKKHAIRENKRYNFSVSPDTLDFFENNTVLTIANNHIMDFGQDGLGDTITNMTNKGINFSGAGMDINAASKPIIYETKDKKIGVICAADRRFQSAQIDKAGTFPADIKEISAVYKDIRNKVDLVIVTIHSGTENINIPSANQILLARKLIACGVKIVHFHHAHCLSGIEKYNSGIILYGTGNFIFPGSQHKNDTKYSNTAIFHIELNKVMDIIDIKIEPLSIDHNGIPRKTDSKNEKEILDTIEKISKCIKKDNSCLTFMRYKELLQPIYLKILYVHLTDITKRIGLINMLKMMYTSLKMQFFIR